MSTIDIGDRQFPAIIHVKRGNELRRYVPERTCRQPIDRDALLELAEDADEAAAMAVVMDASKGARMLADLLLDIARRIREACGEAS